MTFFGGFYSCVEQLAIKTGVLQNHDDIFILICGNCFSEDVTETAREVMSISARLCYFVVWSGGKTMLRKNEAWHCSVQQCGEYGDSIRAE